MQEKKMIVKISITTIIPLAPGFFVQGVNELRLESMNR